MSFSLIINFILALPKLWDMWKSFSASIQKGKEEKREEDLDKAAQKIDKAQTPEEIKNAHDDYIRNL